MDAGSRGETTNGSCLPAGECSQRNCKANRSDRPVIKDRWQTLSLPERSARSACDPPGVGPEVATRDKSATSEPDPRKKGWECARTINLRNFTLNPALGSSICRGGCRAVGTVHPPQTPQPSNTYGIPPPAKRGAASLERQVARIMIVDPSPLPLTQTVVPQFKSDWTPPPPNGTQLQF